MAADGGWCSASIWARAMARGRKQGCIRRPQAGHKAIHTCTSWYAYAAMFGSSIVINTRIHRGLPYNCLHQYWLSTPECLNHTEQFGHQRLPFSSEPPCLCWHSLAKRLGVGFHQRIPPDASEEGRYPPPPSRAPSLCPATVSLTPSAGFNDPGFPWLSRTGTRLCSKNRNSTTKNIHAVR